MTLDTNSSATSKQQQQQQLPSDSFQNILLSNLTSSQSNIGIDNNQDEDEVELGEIVRPKSSSQQHSNSNLFQQKSHKPQLSQPLPTTTTPTKSILEPIPKL
jgi:hypothetical protein